MDQISPPFRIAIVAMLAVCALWFTVLKPKDPSAGTAASDATAPGVTGLSNDVNAAKGAAAKSDAANAKAQAATGGTEPKANTTATATAKPKVAAEAKSKSAATGAHAAVAGNNGGIASNAKTGDASAPLLRALDRKDAVVLLFWNRRGSDDRAVRRAVLATARHRGRVVVKAAPVAQVARYESITSGVQVLQSPTVLVIGPDHKAHAVTGFTTTSELDQVVSDTLKAASPAKK